MLAQPKRKTFLTLNPRGKLWSDDKNKYGQKLMESMGWENGKGLGKDGSGMTEHLRVKYKCDYNGIGFKSSNYDESNDNNYDEILLELSKYHNSDNNSEVKVSNLEKESQKFKKRVHYNKFIRAKNLSNCSDNDFACIFGKSAKKCNENEKINNEKIDNDFNGETKSVNNGETFKSNINLHDYFKIKMSALKKKDKCFDDTNTVQIECDQKSHESTENGGNGITDSEVKKKRKRNKKRENIQNHTESHVTEEFINDTNRKNLISENNDNSQYNFDESQRLGDSDGDKPFKKNLNEIEMTNSNDKPKKLEKRKKKKKKINDFRNIEINTEIDRNEITENHNDILTQNHKDEDETKDNNEVILHSKHIQVIGYDRKLPNVEETIVKFSFIREAIVKSKEFGTTNLLSIKGYGFKQF